DVAKRAHLPFRGASFVPSLEESYGSGWRLVVQEIGSEYYSSFSRLVGRSTRSSGRESAARGKWTSLVGRRLEILAPAARSTSKRSQAASDVVPALQAD